MKWLEKLLKCNCYDCAKNKSGYQLRKARPSHFKHTQPPKKR